MNQETKTVEINQEWVDNLKSQPINVQVMELLKFLDSNVDVTSDSVKSMLLQFRELLMDIKIANKNVGNEGDFYQLRVDEVMRMRGLK
jgi:hypothetical protein